MIIHPLSAEGEEARRTYASFTSKYEHSYLIEESSDGSESPRLTNCLGSEMK